MIDKDAIVDSVPGAASAPDAVNVVVVRMPFDHIVTVTMNGAGRVLGTFESMSVAAAVAHHLRGLSQEALADLWERA